MNHLDDVYGILTANHQYITLMHEKDKIIAFEKGDLLFIFNFHPYQSFEHYRIGTKWASEHLIILDTDENRFDGKDRLRYGHSHYFPIIKEKWMNRTNYIQLYLPSRTAIVLIAKENLSKYQQKEDDNSV
jgi:1,4-alpha-glucan branching enzyme